MHARYRMAALAAALALAVATPADAQLGGLGRRIAEKAVEKALPTPESNAGESSSRGRGTAYTPERVDQFIAVLSPTVEQARRLAEWRRTKDAFEAKQNARIECMQRIGRTLGMPDPNSGDEVERINAQLASVTQRLGAATSDAQRIVLSDSMQILTEASTIAMFPALKQCGPRPPSYGEEPRVDVEALKQRATAARFTTSSLGLMRERVAAWLLTGSTTGLSAESVAALDARRTQLEALKPYFEAVEWTHWGDLDW